MKRNNSLFFKWFNFGIVAAALLLSACSSDEDPFFSASADDYPRILNTDLPEGTKGNMATIANIDRTQNFTYELLVTPVAHTTVAWFIDGEQVCNDLAIDIPVLAGDHIVKIVATTTQGKSTSRTCKLIVRPLAGDPELASDGKSRWLTIGTTKTIDCTNVESVSKVFIGKQEASNVSFANGKLTFDVPAMEEGDYMVTIEDATEMRYGCGWFTVSQEKYVAPAEKTLWKGDVTIDWNADLLKITAEQLTDVPVGANINVYFELIEAEYHAMRITSPRWGDTPKDDFVTQFNITEETPNPFVFVYDEHAQALVQERGAICLVGFGYKVTKITYTK